MQSESVHPPKSQNDQRQYEGLTLPNGLKLLFISDSQATKSACSISVGVGSAFDVDRSLGIAHFLEHMLFMGSKKFPQHNEYSSFITDNSGSDNAYTSDDETNYYFQIKNSAFVEAVQRITNFFTGALLKAQYIEKERQAVHQEFVLWSNDDNSRKWQILRKMGSPPYSRFSIGNQQTLNHPNIREDLVNFYEKYYSSNIINGVLYSNLSIEQMKKQLTHFFQEIPNKNVQLPTFPEHFTKQQRGKFIQMHSIKDESIMQFFWLSEYLRPFYKNHISEYLSHILGHEGKNSLFSILKKKQLANQLSAYTHHLKSQTMVCIELKLTEQGQQHYQEVYNIVMDYMSSLEASQQVYNEIKQNNSIQFQFKQKSKVARYVVDLSSKMHNYPLVQVLNFSVLNNQFDGGLLKRVLGQINPFNVIIVFSHNQEIKDSITEKYLGAKYKVLDLPARNKILQKVEQIPPNRFLPIDTKLLQVQPNIQKNIVPKKIRDNLFYLQDVSFRVCKCGISLDVFNTNQKDCFLDFYTTYLQFLFKQLSYPAQTLQTQVDYNYADDSISISIFGFNDTVSKLFTQLGKQFKNISQSEESETAFHLALEKIVEEKQNFYFDEADQIAESTLQLLLIENSQKIEQSLKTLKKYKPNILKTKIDKFWKESHFQWVVIGNISKDSAIQIVTSFENNIRTISDESKLTKINPVRCLKLTKDIRHETLLTSQDLSSSCCIVYYQAGSYSEALFYKLKLLQNHIVEPFFNALRTEKQLAYYLTCQVEKHRGVLGLKFILVSSTLDAYGISKQIKQFVTQFFGNLSENMAGDKLKQIKQSVITKVSTPHQNLRTQYQFIGTQISERTYYFTRKSEEEVRKYIDAISLEDLSQVWKQINDRSLDVLVVSLAHQEAYKKHEAICNSFEEVKKDPNYFDDGFLFTIKK